MFFDYYEASESGSDRCRLTEEEDGDDSEDTLGVDSSFDAEFGDDRGSDAALRRWMIAQQKEVDAAMREEVRAEVERIQQAGSIIASLYIYQTINFV